MEDRRKSKRMDLEARLMVKRLDLEEKQAVLIQITDVSRTGVGFSCEDKLELGAVYECYLTIWTRDVIHTFLEIQRIGTEGQKPYHYGAIFVGMSQQDASRISVYENFNEAQGDSHV